MAIFQLSDFLSRARETDLARPNMFEVIITPPKGLSNVFDTNDANLISLYCESSHLPTQELLTKRLHIYGETSPRVVGVSYGEKIAMTFYLDADMKMKAFFDDWLDIAVDRNSNQVSYPDQYKSTIYVAQLKTLNTTTSYEVKLTEVFPITVRPIFYDYMNANSVVRMEVIFEYRKWYAQALAAPTSPENIGSLSNTVPSAGTGPGSVTGSSIAPNFGITSTSWDSTQPLTREQLINQIPVPTPTPSAQQLINQIPSVL